MTHKPGDVVVVIGKSNSKVRDQDKTKLLKGTYLGDLRVEDAECAVLLENGDIWVGLKREVRAAKEQE